MTDYAYRGHERDMACGEKWGTITGAHRHRRAGQKPCDACLDAENAYRRRWRELNPRARTTEERDWNRARQRTLTELAALHREEYQTLFRRHLANIYQEADR